MSDIRFLQRKQIDDARWNSCIAQSHPALPYALSFYLDAVAENWGAVVAGDYETVLPLVWMSKLGVKLLYQPYYCQQLGLFGAQAKDRNRQLALLSEATKHVYVNIQLNSTSTVAASDFKLKPRKNLLLHLLPDYSILLSKFSQNHGRNIARAQRSGYTFTENLELKAFEAFYLKNINRKVEHFKPKHEQLFKRLMVALTTHRMSRIFAALNKEGMPVAAVFVVPFQGRLCAIVNTSNAEGKKNGASHFVFSEVIKHYAGQNLWLDFEGSSVAGIARFYEGFGAQTETYWQLKTNWLR
ncbi:MAG: GNAT family N-acetyltransferase [Bacteroidetes bacterium]|nr:GNAT family N-acetyltransferase [Bacteroidota bacterium]